MDDAMRLRPTIAHLEVTHSLESQRQCLTSLDLDRYFLSNTAVPLPRSVVSENGGRRGLRPDTSDFETR